MAPCWKPQLMPGIKRHFSLLYELNFNSSIFRYRGKTRSDKIVNNRPNQPKGRLSVIPAHAKHLHIRYVTIILCQNAMIWFLLIVSDALLNTRLDSPNIKSVLIEYKT